MPKEICSPCEESAISAEYLKICRRIGNKKKCKTLLNKISSEEITVNQLYKEIKKLVKGKKIPLKTVKQLIKEIRDEDD